MCIVEKVRSEYASEVYMGHTEKKRKKEPLQATNINGEPIEGVWWVFQDGKWVAKEIGDAKDDNASSTGN